MDRQQLHRLVLAPALVAVALLTAACGSSASHGVAQLPASSTTNAPAGTTVASTSKVGPAQQRELLKFVQCMRSHGVADFPDPNGQGAFPSAEVQALKGSPRAKAALYECKGDLPIPSSSLTTPEAEAAVLKFAQCMRSHGVPNFPDPGSQTGHTASSLDPNSPEFQRAAKDCRSFLAPVAGAGAG